MFFNVEHPLFSCVPSVFWDLYCAAPDRRETCEHSSEAKAFHDYVSQPKHIVSSLSITKVEGGAVLQSAFLWLCCWFLFWGRNLPGNAVFLFHGEAWRRPALNN